MLQRLFRPRQARIAGETLYAGLVDQARRPALYRDLGVADRIDARFELYVLHLSLLLARLKGEGEAGAEIGQAVFDTFVGALDDALRELGVGDLSVAKKMRKLGEAVYGRILGYQKAVEAQDREALSGLLARAVFAEESQTEQASGLVDYTLRMGQALQGMRAEDILRGRVIWPEVLS
ncbi:ubiquinol-cytochrome C chaperone family protein [Brevundimonas aveniformis]|uniref:ubiquinol-cytochrome C chaperone family protein n=1 Tax=Brevundimonas aveniformis TaxID=370977 RepID=UPI0003F61AA3|nr:ubiquinol-cytochrome C chaperone family protein [Brevundimonas aveniformis]